MLSHVQNKVLLLVVYNCFFADTGPATNRRCDVILRAVWKVGTWVAAGRFPGKGRVGCCLKALLGSYNLRTIFA